MTTNLIVCSKQFQRTLTKQGLKFKLNTKVVSAEKTDGKVTIKTEAAKGGKEETVRLTFFTLSSDTYTKLQLDADVVLVAVGRRPYVEGLNLEAVGVEKDDKGRIIIDDQFNTSVKNIKCIGDVTFGPMLAHKAEEEGLSSTFLYSIIPLLTFVRRYRCCRIPENRTRTRQLRCHPLRRLHAPRGRLGRQD